MLKKKKKKPATPVLLRKGGQGLRLLSYNIHQGLTIHRRQIAISLLKEAIKSLRADVVLLQEVAGSTRAARSGDGISVFQLEELADQVWPYHAYGRNAVFSGGFHGNAILSRYPIHNVHNLDITIRPLDKRGVLHGEIDFPSSEFRLHIMAVHLGLLQYERRRQLKKLVQYIERRTGDSSRLLMAGDFNDWREKVSRRLSKRVRLSEAFLHEHRRHARTFPSRFPMLCLDRIYFRGVQLEQATRLKGRPWLYLSDHLPLLADFVVS